MKHFRSVVWKSLPYLVRHPKCSELVKQAPSVPGQWPGGMFVEISLRPKEGVKQKRLMRVLRKDGI
jgi:hypothetical protein